MDVSDEDPPTVKPILRSARMEYSGVGEKESQNFGERSILLFIFGGFPFIDKGCNYLSKVIACLESTAWATTLPS